MQQYVREYSVQLRSLWESDREPSDRILISTREAINFMKHGGTLIWRLNVPIDFYEPWNFEAATTFIKILQRNQQYCKRMVQSDAFIKLHSERKFDLVVVDHIVQACTTVMASFLNASTVQYSNWPVCDGYIASFNVPSNPSSVPRTLSPFSGISMNFLQRAFNTYFYIVMSVLRSVEGYVTSRLYRSIGITGVDIFDIEAKQILYGTRSGILFESARPLTNRIKYFGCPSCG
ncbi:unnamed protein product [Enterobius vermicularis]|uniref:glucuronosyltransferase n=1 Tax=Enterobius vermicularis TaxID=51028 RepID=A0A0N4VGW9_ENTVE|nr:unnamed protein product [Enterobius vermicularis]